MRDAGAEVAFSATSPPQGDLDLHARQPARHRPGQPPRDGHRPHGHRPGDVGGVPRAAAVGRRQRPRLRLVGVRHRRPATTRRSPSPPSPTAPRRSWSAEDPNVVTRRVDYRPRAVGDLPETMPAAVLKGAGRARGRAGAGARRRRRRRARRGRAVRHLRQRPPHGARGLGRAGQLARPRVDRHGRRGRRRRDQLAARRRRRRRTGGSAAATCRDVPAGRPSLCEASGHARHRPGARRLRHLQAGAGRRAARRCPRASTPGPPPWPSRWRSPCTASTRAARSPATGCWCSAPGRSARSSIAALRAIGVDDVRCVEPGPTPPGAGRPPSAPRRCSTPTTSRCRTSPSPGASSTTPSTSCSSAPARPRRWRPAWPSSCGAAPSCSSAPASSGPASIRTASCSTSWSSPGPSPTTTTASSRPSRCSRPARLPIDDLAGTRGGAPRRGARRHARPRRGPARPARCWCGR